MGGVTMDKIRVTLKGAPLRDLNCINAAVERAYKRIAENPDLRIIWDLESGWPTVVTKEEHERYCKLYDDCFPKNKNLKISGKLVFFGTGGSLEDLNDFKKMFLDGK